MSAGRRTFGPGPVTRLLAVAVVACLPAFPANAQNRLGSTWQPFGPGVSTETGIFVLNPTPGQESGVAQCVSGGVNPGATYTVSGKFWYHDFSSLPIIFVGARWYSDESCSISISRATTERDLWEAGTGSSWVMGATMEAPAGARSVQYQIGVRADSVTKVDLGLSGQLFSGPVGVRVALDALDPLTLCGAGSVRLKAVATGGTGTFTTYTWYRNQALHAQGASPELTVTQSGTWTVSVTDSAPSTSPPSAPVVVTAGSAPVIASVQSNSPVCSGENLQLAAAYVAGAAYAWTGPGGFTSTEQNPTRAAVGLDAAGEYSVTATLAGCESEPAKAMVVVNATPAAPSISAPATALPHRSGLPASVTPRGGSSFEWSIDPAAAGSITSGQGTAAVTFSVGEPGLLRLVVVETNAKGCASPEGTADVTVLDPTGSLFTVTPCRVVNTRREDFPTGLGAPSIGAAGGPDRSFPLTAGACGIPSTAKAVVLNVTVAETAGAGYLTLYPGDGTPPATSTINFASGQVKANNVFLPLASDGSGTIKVKSGATGTLNVLIDVVGYFE